MAATSLVLTLILGLALFFNSSVLSSVVSSFFGLATTLGTVVFFWVRSHEAEPWLCHRWWELWPHPRPWRRAQPWARRWPCRHQVHRPRWRGLWSPCGETRTLVLSTQAQTWPKIRVQMRRNECVRRSRALCSSSLGLRLRPHGPGWTRYLCNRAPLEITLYIFC